MGMIKAIRTEADYEAALARIDALMDAETNTPEGDELDVLTDLVEHYEEKSVPMGLPSPVAAIEFRLEQAGLTPRDLIPFMGSRAKVSEVLSGKRSLTMPMARALLEHFGIRADVLLQRPGATLSERVEGLERRYWAIRPLSRAMARGRGFGLWHRTDTIDDSASHLSVKKGLICGSFLERVIGFEPTTLCLASTRSTN